MIKIYKKFKVASPAVKASIVYLFANLILKGISLISGPIFTRIMSLEQYGIVNTFMSWQNLIIVIVTLNLTQGVFNNGMLEFKENRDEFQFSLITVVTLLACIYGFFTIIFIDRISTFLELSPKLIFVMFMHFVFVTSYHIWNGRQRYEYKYKTVAVVMVLSAVLSLALGVTAVLFSRSDQAANARIYMMEGVNIVIGIYFYLCVAIRAKFRARLKYCIYALKFNIPLLPHYLSMYVLSGSDRIMISKLINMSATAIYSVAYTMASVINIFWQSTEAALSPWIYDKLEQGDTTAVKKITIKIIGLFGCLCLLCTLFAPEIMKILAPDEYSEGVYAMPSIAVGVYFTAVYSIYMRIELFYKKTAFSAIATGTAALINIILNYIFIPKYGFVAAGYTTMFSYALLSLLHYANVKKCGCEKAIDNKLIFIISCGIVVSSIMVSFLYKFIIVRYSLILLVLLFGLIKHKLIFATLKKIF